MSVDLVDTHCHLFLAPLADSLEAVLARAQASGVRQYLNIGTTLQTSREAVEMAHRLEAVFAAVGIHPTEAETASDMALVELERLAEDPRVVAIGEVGLDFYRQRETAQQQAWLLRVCLAIAKRRDLPVAIHCRDAYDALMEICEREAEGPWRGVIHCASGPPSFIQQALAMGFHISFAGNVTFPNAETLRQLVSLVPDERLLIETDAPFLAPQPVRGRPNEPAHVLHTAERLAQLRGLTLEAVAELTSRNARSLFRLPMSRSEGL